MNSLNINTNIGINENHCIINYTNKSQEIIKILVSEEDFKELNKFKWYLRNNYVCCKINNKMWSMHRYIMIKILNSNITSKIPIDHINNIRYDNRRINLRISTHSENSRNKNKKENSTSQYIGVSYYKKTGIWKMSIKIPNSKPFMAYYKNEHWAGYHYNLCCIQYKFNTAKLNIISNEKIEGFEFYVKRKSKQVSKNIIFTNRYELRLYSKYIGSYLTLEEAERVRDLKKEENEKIKKDIINNTPITYNKDGECIMEIFDKYKNKKCETLIDEIIYYDLMKINWYCDEDGYIKNNKNTRLHRYILNYTGKHVVDHIDNNKLNNKLSNLRICTAKQNSMNKSSSKNSSSKYVGVSYNKLSNKWMAYIIIDGFNKYLGLYITELEACIARDKATKLYYGEFGNLNLS
jgi:hypothetical protein